MCRQLQLYSPYCKLYRHDTAMKDNISLVVAVTLFIFCLHVTAAVEAEVVCSDAPRGFYCSSDLKSVRECHQPGGGNATMDTPCSPNQRCACGLLRRCENDEPMYVPFAPVPPIPVSFVARFRGRQNLTVPLTMRDFNVFGLVFQDEISMSLRVKTWLVDQQGQVESQDRLVVPNVSSGWTEYKVTTIKDFTGCTRMSLTMFPKYFGELRNSSVQRDNGRWIYRKGPRFPNDMSIVKRWRLFPQSKRNFYFPRFENTDEFVGPVAKTTIATRLQYRLLRAGRIPDSKFEVPSQCIAV